MWSLLQSFHLRVKTKKIKNLMIATKEVLWPKKLEISHASQILTNDRQILVLSQLSNYYCTLKVFLSYNSNGFLINTSRHTFEFMSSTLVYIKYFCNTHSFCFSRLQDDLISLQNSEFFSIKTGQTPRIKMLLINA